VIDEILSNPKEKNLYISSFREIKALNQKKTKVVEMLINSPMKNLLMEFHSVEKGADSESLLSPSSIGMFEDTLRDTNKSAKFFANFQAMFSNPQRRDSLLNRVPSAKAMIEEHLELLDIMANPQILNMMRENLLRRAGEDGGFGMQNPMLGANPLMGFGGNPVTNPSVNGVPAVNPREAYSAQLLQLNDLGYNDDDKCIKALQATGGDVNAAVEKLFSS
jgi:hypothetical protein